VVPIPKGELRVINADPHNQREKGLISVPTPQGEIMWVHSDIVKRQQWTTVTSRKSRDKAKTSSSNVANISTRETEEDVTSLTSSRDGESALVAYMGTSPTSKTRSGKQYLKQYGEPIANSSQLTEEAIKQSIRPSVEKQKELLYFKALLKAMRDHQLPSILISWLN